MKQQIIITDISTIRPVFQQGSAENIKRFTQLKKLFESGGEYKVFAEPIASGKQNIVWNTEYAGKIFSFQQLSPAEQEQAKGRLKYQVNKMYKAVVKYVTETGGTAKNIEELFQLLDSCIEIPDYKDIYVVQEDDGNKNFVIIRWGFTTDDFNAQMGLVKKLVPVKVSSFEINAIYENGKIAPNEKILIEIAGNQQMYATNTEGKLILEDIALLTTINAWQTDKDNNQVNVHEYICDHNDTHEFRIALPFADMKIRVIDEKNKPLTDIPLKFEYNNKIVEATPDSNGFVFLSEIPVGSYVTCAQILDNTEVNKTGYECEKNRLEYLFRGTRPITSGKMIITANDQNGNPAANFKYLIEYPGFIGETETDENGRILLNDVPFGTKLTITPVTHAADNQPISLNYEKGTENYTLAAFIPPPPPPPPPPPVIEKKPEPATVKIQALDGKKNPIPNLRIVFENNKITSTKYTDSDGIAVLPGITASSHVNAAAEYKGYKKNIGFYVEKEEEFHQLILGRRRFLFLFWLLPLLLLLGLLFWWFLLPLIIAPPIVVVTDTVKRDTVIVDTIKPKPVVKGLTIVVINKKTNSPVGNATVEIEFNGQKLTATTNAEGKVNFAEVPEQPINISAKINAPEFNEHLISFEFVKEKTIFLSNESAEVSDIVLPCGETVKSKGYGSTMKTVNVKRTKGTVRMVFDMFEIADQMIIYRGKASEISDDKILYQTNGFVRRYNTAKFNFESADSLITVRIIGGDEKKTEWYFRVNCN